MVVTRDSERLAPALPPGLFCGRIRDGSHRCSDDPHAPRTRVGTQRRRLLRGHPPGTA